MMLPNDTQSKELQKKFEDRVYLALEKLHGQKHSKEGCMCTSDIAPAFRFVLEAADAHLRSTLERMRDAGPQDIDMAKYEGIGADGGIDTTIFDSGEDPRGTKNGEQIAYLANFASDTGKNCQNELWRAVINKEIERRK